MNRPNIVFVFADQMRGMDMGCAGNAEVQTPNMDRLAKQGVRMAKSYANTPVCGPSRATLLTGRYPLGHGVIVNDLPLSPDIPSLGQIFNQHGYKTGYIGKWHLDETLRNEWIPPGPRRHGFAKWAVYNNSHQYYRPEKYYADRVEPMIVEGYEPVIQTDLAIRFLEDAAVEDDQPFCLYVSWGPPHDPYHLVPDEYKQCYYRTDLALRPNAIVDSDYVKSNAAKLDPVETYRDYYAAITALDDQLGRIMHTLDQTGLADNTILVFTSDHGDMLFSHGYLNKLRPYEEAISVPLLVRWPGKLEAGRIIHDLFALVDMAPTLLGLSGIDPLDGMEGTNYAPLLLGRSMAVSDSVFLADYVSGFEDRRQPLKEWRGIRTDRYTYAEFFDGSWFLFDNRTDPFQLRNVLNDPDYASVRAECAACLKRWLEMLDDPFLPGPDMIRSRGLTEWWNRKESIQQPSDPRWIEPIQTIRDL